MSMAPDLDIIEPSKANETVERPSYKHLQPVIDNHPKKEPPRPLSLRSVNQQIVSHVKDTIKRPFVRTIVEFTLFAQLPIEIREQIWEACIMPRVHELHPCSNTYRNRMTFRSNSAGTPSLFHVSQESRRVALKHHKLMVYSPSVIPRDPENEEESTMLGKGILRFYYAPKLDTLFLNSLMGLFVMFMLLEEPFREGDVISTKQTEGVLAGWERVALDAERAQLTILLAGAMGHSPSPRFKHLMPDLKELIIAFDYTKSGKTRFRTSVWPGENGTSLKRQGHRKPRSEWTTFLDECIIPLGDFLCADYVIRDCVKPRDARDYAGMALTNEIPRLTFADVERKKFLRGDFRYALRWSCSIFGVRPRGVLRRL